MILPAHPHLQSGHEDFLPATEEIGKWRQNTTRHAHFFEAASRNWQISKQRCVAKDSFSGGKVGQLAQRKSLPRLPCSQLAQNRVNTNYGPSGSFDANACGC
jgi:hypothetical protein